VAGSQPPSLGVVTEKPKRIGSRRDSSSDAGVIEECQDGGVKDMAKRCQHGTRTGRKALWGQFPNGGTGARTRSPMSRAFSTR